MIRHLLPVIAAAALVVGLTVRPVDQAAAIAAPAASQPFATWEVPREDISSLGTPRSELLVKAFSPTMDPVAYLDEAARFGQKVVLYFRDTVDDSRGTISTSRIGPWVAKVRHHPALWGYLTVKEPSWSGISVSEMRSLRKAFRTADPDHPTVALLGDIPNFGTSDNPWASGIADVLWVDWYPVTFSRGYIATARTHFPKVRAYVDKVTPGTPVWLMVQGHEYRPGDRRAPTGSELEREVLDGARYLHADGFIFYTYHNALYGRDLERNGSLWSTARSIMARTRAGTFLPPNSDPSDPAFRRLAGADRYATAAAISAASFANGAPVAYLATGANFPDALAGAVAAARAGGPLLLTTTDVLPTPTANELHRLAPGRIVVLGSSGVVGNAIVSGRQGAPARCRRDSSGGSRSLRHGRGDQRGDVRQRRPGGLPRDRGELPRCPRRGRRGGQGGWSAAAHDDRRPADPDGQRAAPPGPRPDRRARLERCGRERHRQRPSRRSCPVSS